MQAAQGVYGLQPADSGVDGCGPRGRCCSWCFSFQMAMWSLSVILGVAGAPAVGGGHQDAKIAGDGLGSGGFDAAKVLADGDRCRNGDNGTDDRELNEIEAGRRQVVFHGCFPSLRSAGSGQH
jgi:hypothetical protein